jgi:hypothetical protein
MLTCVPTRVLVPAGAHPANATPWLESARSNLDARCSLLIHTEEAPLTGPSEFTVIPLRAQSAASAHSKQLSIPILLPR